MDQRELDRCQEKLGYRFRDPRLLAMALTHSSAKKADRECNERLEFLGDAVLGMIISEMLYLEVDRPEGELTRIKSAVVRGTTLSQVTAEMGIVPHIVVGKGIRARKELPPALPGNVFEAIVAAIYLDGGLDRTREFVRSRLGFAVDRFQDERHEQNFKSALQQRVQKDQGTVPSYEVLSETGPDHHKKFEVAALVDGIQLGVAWGGSKKEAEQDAARKALRSLKEDERVARKKKNRKPEDGEPETGSCSDDDGPLDPEDEEA